MNVTKEEIEQIAIELEDIKKKDYNIGDVSDSMKKVVNAVYGDEDWSCSGYWTRAQHIVKEYQKFKIETFFDQRLLVIQDKK